MKIAYSQGWGTYPNQTIVSVGMTAREVIDWMKKQKKCNKKFLESYEASEEFNDISNVKGLAWSDIDHGFSVLMLSDWKNDWNHFDTLLHECCHLVHHILGKSRAMMDEDEAKAYQTEHLFREIRNNLFRLSNQRSNKPKK